MSDLAIRVQNLSKRYRIGQREKYKTLRDTVADAIGTPFRLLRPGAWRAIAGARASANQLWALKDVSFEVKRGEVLGVIGHNGAGKSTLLKILSRITEPTAGRAEIHGRLASLLEVGTGFHPELTGRENIYLNGAILGMRRAEIARSFDEIVAFAEVEKFIDTAVKHYSSGMYLRLAFAVAAHLEPEILLVDEVLAVGDAAFQKKCLGKMREVASEGRTVLFVSHNLAAVQQLTHSSILLSNGQICASGPSAHVIARYLDTAMDRSTTIYNVEHAPRRHSNLRREVEFLSLELEEYPTKLVPAGADIHLRLTVRGNQAIQAFRFSITIFKIDGTPIGNVFGPEIHAIGKNEVATFRMELHGLQLARGSYSCALATGVGNHLTPRIEFDIVLDVLHFEMLGELRSDGTMSEWYPEWGVIQFAEPKVVRIG